MKAQQGIWNAVKPYVSKATELERVSRFFTRSQYNIKIMDTDYLHKQYLTLEKMTKLDVILKS
jgi:hypothetical protein